MRQIFFSASFVFLTAAAALNAPTGQPFKGSSQKVLGHTQPHKVETRELDKVLAVFDKHDYDVERVRAGEAPVPRIHLAAVPVDIKRTDHQKKETFIQIMLPLILEVNESVMRERNKLMALKGRMDGGYELRSYEAEYVASMMDKYRVKSGNMDELLTRVDIIPPSLALAQASVESGWLTSVAARTKSSTFGHMRTLKDIEAFSNLYENVEAYILNLNRHNAYKDLRTLRADMRKKKQPLCSIQLASGLTRYCIRGNDYIRDIRTMIKQNEFKAFDQVTLDS